MNLSKSDLDKLLKNSEENIIESNKVIALNELIIKTVKKELKNEKLQELRKANKI